MTFSLLIYGLLIGVLTYNAKIVNKRNFVAPKFWQFISCPNILFPILVFGLLSSIRWNVGVDCNSYMEGYYESTDLYLENKGEPAYWYLIRLFRSLGASHVPLFFCFAIIQLGFCYYGLQDYPSIMVFFPIMLFLSGDYLMWMNGVRQVIAFCIFVYVLSLCVKRKYLRAILFACMAIAFHKSAIIIVPICFLSLIKTSKIPNVYIQLALILMCYIYRGLDVSQQANFYVEGALSLAGYESDTVELLDRIYDITFGFRPHLLLFSHIIVVSFSKRMHDYYKSPLFNIMYTLYFIGICTWLIFYANSGMSRICMYFTLFTPIIFAFCANYLYRERKNHSLKYIILLVLIGLLLVRSLYDLYVSSNTTNDEYILYKTIFNNEIPGKFHVE